MSAAPVSGPSSGRTRLHSPEQVALDIEIAGPMSRMLAFSIDYGLILLIEALVVFGLFMLLISLAAAEPYLESLAEWFDGDVKELPALRVLLVLVGFYLILDLVFQFVYFVAFEMGWQGRSPGKAFLGLRVVHSAGLPLRLRESLIRNLLRGVDILPQSYFVGFVTMLVSRRTQRLGDHAADTLVVRESRVRRVRPIVLEELAGDSAGLAAADAFRLDREQLGRLGSPERRLLRQTLRHLAKLPLRERSAFAARTSEVLRVRIGWADELAPAERVPFLMALLRAVEPPSSGLSGSPGSPRSSGR